MPIANMLSNSLLGQFDGVTRRALVAILGIWLACEIGCSSGHELETAPVRGTVTLDGSPVSAGGVRLVPEQGRGATGTLAADGTFVLGTYGQSDGAIVGKHKAAVLQYREIEGGPGPPPGFVPIPAKYQNSESSGLEFEVKPGQENVIEIKLTSQP